MEIFNPNETVTEKETQYPMSRERKREIGPAPDNWILVLDIGY